jgi:hypothetical protein
VLAAILAERGHKGPAAMAKIATAVTNEEKRNPKSAKETRDCEATIGDGLAEKHGARAKPQAR